MTSPPTSRQAFTPFIHTWPLAQTYHNKATWSCFCVANSQELEFPIHHRVAAVQACYYNYVQYKNVDTMQ